MNLSRPSSVPLNPSVKLSISQSPTNQADIVRMREVPYASAVGSIMYSMVCCRPDLAFAMSVISRFMSNPGKAHWDVVKGVLRYLNGTVEYGLKFQKAEEDEEPLVGFVDDDFAANLDTRKSITGYVFTLYGTAISWKSTQQPVVALSTTEAELMAITEGVKEAIWLQGLLREMGIYQESVTIFCDNQSAIQLAKQIGRAHV